MTTDLDLSPEAVERLAWRVHESKAGRDVRSEAVATLRALAAENARLRAEDEASAHEIARLKDSETHWLNEAERLRAERDAAWQAGAEAMRAETWDAHREFKERAAEARRALRYVCGDLSKRVPSVGKHEARNHEHLRRIYAEAKDEFPRFADTLAWLLWHDIIDSDRLAALTEPENARLRAERDAAWQAGAEAMRERAAYEVAESGAIVDHPSVFMGGPSRNAIRIAGAFANAIRALPIPDKEGET